jgi:hypothetical protein
MYGSWAYGRATTTTTGGQTMLISKPSSTNTIVCFNGRPEGVQGIVYDAEFLRDSLGAKYNIKK